MARLNIFLIYITFSLVMLGYVFTTLHWTGGKSILALGLFFHIMAYATYFFGDKANRNKTFMWAMLWLLVFMIVPYLPGLSDTIRMLLSHIPLTVYLYYLLLHTRFLGSLEGRTKSVLKVLSVISVGLFIVALLLKVMHLQGASMSLLVSGLSVSVVSFFVGVYKWLTPAEITS